MKKLSKFSLFLTTVIFLTACDIDSETTQKTLNTRENISGVSATTGDGQFTNGTVSSNDDIFPHLTKATVTNVVDGDTIDVVLEDGKEQRIRMILINTPESTGEHKNKPEPYGVEASQFTEALLLDADVWLEYDEQQIDYYDRTLAYVWVKELNYTYKKKEYYETEVMFNEVLLQHGLAHVAVYEPNVRYKNRFYVIENKAKQNRVGIWE